MRFLRLSILTLALAAAFTLAVDAADARVGGGKSQGSRGGQTFNPPPPTPTTPRTVAPIGRSMTEPGAPSKVQAVNRPATERHPIALRRVRRIADGRAPRSWPVRAPLRQRPLRGSNRLCLLPRSAPSDRADRRRSLARRQLSPPSQPTGAGARACKSIELDFTARSAEPLPTNVGVEWRQRRLRHSRPRHRAWGLRRIREASAGNPEPPTAARTPMRLAP